MGIGPSLNVSNQLAGHSMADDGVITRGWASGARRAPPQPQFDFRLAVGIDRAIGESRLRRMHGADWSDP